MREHTRIVAANAHDLASLLERRHCGCVCGRSQTSPEDHHLFSFFSPLEITGLYMQSKVSGWMVTPLCRVPAKVRDPVL